MQRTQQHRMLIAITVVSLYLLLTAALFYWHFTQEMAAGNVPKEMRFYEGSVKDGEFWYRVRRFSGNPFNPNMTTRLVRLNLESGKETETEFTFDEDYVFPIWVGDALYVFTRQVIYQATGDTMTKLEPAPFTVCLSVPFLYDGQMTVIYDASSLKNGGRDEGDRDNVRLAHWVDGQWVEGRSILVPAGRFWVDDPTSGAKVLFPRTSEFRELRISSSTSYYFTYNLIVAQHEQQVHLMLADPAGFCSAYRNGFEFADERSEAPSALEPENAPHEVSGWEPILADRADDDWVQMACDHEGLLFVSTNFPQRFVRRRFGGISEELSGDTSHKPSEIFPWIAAEFAGASTYLIHSNPSWSSATIRRIEGNEIQPPHLIVPGFQAEYIARWQRILLRLVSVWLIPIVALVAFQSWYGRERLIDRSAEVTSPIVLAPLWRRAVSFLIDLTILVMVAWILWRLYLWSSGVDWHNTDEMEFADKLTNIEWDIRSVNVVGFCQDLRSSAFGWLTIPFEIQSPLFGIFVASVMPVYAAKIWMESRTGVTPGKWIMGIRTLRTTLRSCGMTRLLLRDLGYYIDAPLLLTPLPAVISMILSDHNQRIGDRLADTIVVQSALIR